LMWMSHTLSEVSVAGFDKRPSISEMACHRPRVSV
jgi:hypothetical protein